jgi:hypothetical protein
MRTSRGEAGGRHRMTWPSVGGGLGACAGGGLGLLGCFAYNLANGPWFPQAEVDPQPAGWVGWWLLGGAGVGGLLGFGMGAGIGRLCRPR